MLARVKREPELQPLSREHHFGLVLARRARRSTEETCAKQARSISSAWQQWLGAHFRVEESALSDLLNAAQEQQLKAEHAQLAHLVAQLEQQPTVALLHEFGTLFDRHIRWEERSLFPELEAGAERERLAAAGQAILESCGHTPRCELADDPQSE